MKLLIKIVIAIIIICAVSGCIRENETLIKKKLLVILQDDMESVVEEIKKEGIKDSTHYNIVEYNVYKGGRYSTKAIVDFYIFRKINVKIVRKYRYHTGVKKWERYYNEYKYYDTVKKQ